MMEVGSRTLDRSAPCALRRMEEGVAGDGLDLQCSSTVKKMF